MSKRILIASAIRCLFILWSAHSAAAQESAQRASGEAQRTPSLVYRESWKETPEVPLTPVFLSNPNLELKVYGANKNDIQVLGSKTNPPHVWTGLCVPSCAVALRHKDDYIDLSGLAKVRWLIKVAGFHVVRPIVKLADGTWLVGDRTDAYSVDWHESEISFADVRWRRLDAEKVVTMGDGKWIDQPDLGKVDEFGFADLMPGSGHGNNGYSDVGWI